VFRYSFAKGRKERKERSYSFKLWNLMRLDLILNSSKIWRKFYYPPKFPMEQFFNPKDSFNFFYSIPPFFPLQFLCSKGPLNDYCKQHNLITEVLITNGFVAENPNPHILHKHKIISRENLTLKSPLYYQKESTLMKQEVQGYQNCALFTLALMQCQEISVYLN
jgi:hypothetical protein